MATYHISLSGEPALCKARMRPCPRSEHYESLEKAQHVAELAHEAYAKALEYPRAASFRFRQNQARIFWELDSGFGSSNSPYSKSGLTSKYVDALRFADYKSGFEEGLESRNYAEAAAARSAKAFAALALADDEYGSGDEGYDGDFAAQDDEEYDETAFKLGFTRGQRIKDADRDEFVTENVVDRTLRGGEVRRKYASARFLQQPFKRGETIVVPAGTQFHSWDAEGNDVYGELREAREVQVNDTFAASIDGGPNGGPNSGDGEWIHLHPAQVSYAGPNGQWRDIVLTPEIIAMNGKPVYEAGVHDEARLRPSMAEALRG